MARRSTPKTPARAPEAAPDTAKPAAEAASPTAGGGAPSLQSDAPPIESRQGAQSDPPAASAAGGEEVLEFGLLSAPEVGPEHARLFAGLNVEDWAGLTPERQDNLVAHTRAALAALGTAQRAVSDVAAAYLGRDDLAVLEVRSRDGRPFRRVGIEFGDAWQSVHVSLDQARVIRADKALQVKATN